MNNSLDKLTGWIKLKYYQNYLAKNHKYRLINCFGNAMKMISKT
jgi:Tfp pilus assembly major pilin PilA